MSDDKAREEFLENNAGRLPEEILSETQRETRAVFALGEEAKKFLTSDLARYITDSAEARCYAATEKLKKVDPTDVKEIMKLQNIIDRFDHYDNSLLELVAAGESAYELYLTENQSD